MTMEKALPEGWVECFIGDYLYLKNGFAFKSKEYVPKSDSTYPIIRISDIDGQHASDVNAAHVQNPALGFEVSTGDLLIAMSGATTGKVGIYNGTSPAFQNQRVGNLKLLSEDFGNTGFRNYIIKNISGEILKIAYGGAQPNISGKAIEGMRLPLPPLAEQQVIADKLDALLAQVATTKTRLERVPETIKRFRQSVLAAAVSGKLTECDVKNWQPTNIGQLAELVTSGSRGWAKFYSDSGSIFIRSQDINSDDLDISEPCYVSLPEKVEGARTSVRRNDLLITITGANVTKCARIKNEITDAYVSQHVALIRLDNAENAPFIELVLKSLEAGRKQLTDMAYGGGKPGLNLQNIKDVHFRIPPLPEQQEIVRRVEELFAHADAVEQQAKAALEKVNNLTQSILAKAFRGELTADWRAANPELISGENSAEALLARIKEERAAQKPKKRATTRRKKKAVSD